MEPVEAAAAAAELVVLEVQLEEPPEDSGPGRCLDPCWTDKSTTFLNDCSDKNNNLLENSEKN